MINLTYKKIIATSNDEILFFTLAKVKKFNSALCWSGCGRLEFLHAVGESVNWYNLFGEHLVKIHQNFKCANTLIDLFSF